MSNEPIQPLRLGERFRAALTFAAEAHNGQGRKGTEVPYVAHLLGVTAIVLEYGGDEDQAIAALLHDAIEDQGGDVMRRQILERFGEHVTGMVNDCTDAEVIPKPPWKERKLAYLAHIPAVAADSMLVSMADKLHNSRAILRDLRHKGPAVFERFKGGRDGTLWYYRSLVEAFEARDPRGGARTLLDELAHTVDELERVAAAYP
ncbi:MAG: HD domain-containing protein [Acidobacteriota bacterium]|jgi:GTP pyrophosphokinase